MRSEQSDEDIHLSAELRAPLAALTERFFDETPIEKIEAARNEGPFALYRLCFHWSSDVVNDGKAVRRLLRVQRGLPPSMRYMQQVRMLALVIDRAVREAYGDPKRPEMPDSHANLECQLIGNPEKPDEIPCPKRLPRGARFLCAVEWAWSPMHNRQDFYHLSTNRPRSHWILWFGYPAPVEFAYQAHQEHLPVAYCPRPKVPLKDAALALLRTKWKEECASGVDRFHMIYSPGLLTADEITVLADLSWGV